MLVQSVNSLLAAIAAYTAVYSMVYVRLFSNNLAPTPNSQLSDFTEADFTGYAGVEITGWLGAAWAGQGAAFQIPSNTIAFNTASPYTVGQVIYGYFIAEGSTPTTYIAAEKFANPVSMSKAGDQIVLGIQLGLSDADLSAVVY